MFIDIHVHTRRLPGPPRDESGQTYASPDELLRRYDEIGVERAVVLPGVSPECCHCPQSNEEVIELAEGSGGRLVPFCNVDPRLSFPGFPFRRVNYLKQFGDSRFL